MTPERWQALKAVFHAALDCAPEQRELLLAERCSGNDSLRAEIISLLAEHEQASTFLGSRAREQAAGALHIDALELAPGSRILHYELIAPLGEGGMGIVYRARDPRLERQVAIKLLPPWAGDPGELAARLQREARAVSALSHPSILTIHEIGELDGQPFIVTELVEGQTLEARIARSPLDLATLLDHAVQITDAVAEAHRRGIIHRDLKPSNVMVTPRGQIKVLDFGLAKLIDVPAAEAPPPAPASLRSTSPLMGTIPYMSPEQSLGHAVDARSDVFSLGVMLYQLATGTLPFRGTGASEILARIRSAPPAPAPALPAELLRIINGCLEKRPERRYADARALHAELQRLRARRAAAPTRRRALAAPVLVLVLALAAAAAAVFDRQAAAPASAPAVRDARFSELTQRRGEERHASFSPDGQWLVYASRAGSRWELRRRSRGPIGREHDVPLEPSATSSDTEPALSPDGRWLAFRSTREGGGLFLMELGASGEPGGAPARKLTDRGASPAWSPDGTEIAYSTEPVVAPEDRGRGELWVISVATGARRRVVATDAVQPSWSPHGGRIAYWGVLRGTGQRDLWTVPAHGGEPVAVTNDPHLDWNPVWSPDGRALYFVSNRSGSMNLWRISIDESSGRPLDSPAPLTAPADYVAGIALSASGRELVYSRVAERSNLERVSVDPERETTVGAPVALTHGVERVDSPSLSPDGQWLVFRAWSGAVPEDLFVMRVDGTERRQLTHDPFKDRDPRWSPDGRRIAFFSNRSGRYEIWTVAPDGTELTQLTHTTGEAVFYPVWSPDGRLVYSHRGHGNFVIDPGIPWAQQAPARLPLEGVAQLTTWAWSADGDRLLGGLRMSEPPVRGLGMYSFTTQSYRVLSAEGSEPALFLRDDQRVLFYSDSSVHLLDPRTGSSHLLYTAAPDQIGRFTLSADDRTLYYSRLSVEADLWLVTLAP
jgi:eukaryotic-like serine/threonine-protein kinase